MPTRWSNSAFSPFFVVARVKRRAYIHTFVLIPWWLHTDFRKFNCFSTAYMYINTFLSPSRVRSLIWQCNLWQPAHQYTIQMRASWPCFFGKQLTQGSSEIHVNIRLWVWNFWILRASACWSFSIHSSAVLATSKLVESPWVRHASRTLWTKGLDPLLCPRRNHQVSS